MFDKLSDFKIKIGNYIVLSTGGDGGHKYISTELEYKGNKRKPTVFFEDKMDEAKLIPEKEITVSGKKDCINHLFC